MVVTRPPLLSPPSINTPLSPGDALARFSTNCLYSPDYTPNARRKRNAHWAMEQRGWWVEDTRSIGTMATRSVSASVNPAVKVQKPIRAPAEELHSLKGPRRQPDSLSRPRVSGYSHQYERRRRPMPLHYSRWGVKVQLDEYSGPGDFIEDQPRVFEIEPEVPQSARYPVRTEPRPSLWRHEHSNSFSGQAADVKSGPSLPRKPVGSGRSTPSGLRSASEPTISLSRSFHSNPSSRDTSPIKRQPSPLREEYILDALPPSPAGSYESPWDSSAPASPLTAVEMNKELHRIPCARRPDDLSTIGERSESGGSSESVMLSMQGPSGPRGGSNKTKSWATEDEPVFVTEISASEEGTFSWKIDIFAWSLFELVDRMTTYENLGRLQHWGARLFKALLVLYLAACMWNVVAAIKEAIVKAFEPLLAFWQFIMWLFGW